MTITTDDVRTFATNAKMRTFTNLFDEWLESHDAEVRNEAIIARETRTPAELIQTAWDAAYELPEGRKLPAGTPYVCKRGPVEGRIRISFWPNGDRFENAYSEDVRTLEPLPPLIPDDCMAVWASLKGLGDPQNPTRCVWLRDSGRHSWRNRWNVVAAEVDLIDPKPVPEEER
jgi:hypothetical protein